MDSAVVFAASYATLAVLAALGLDRVGRVANRRARPAIKPGDALPWPHGGSVALHTVIAAVAAGAGIVIAGVFAVGHHRPGELALLAVPVVIGLAVLTRLRHGQVVRSGQPSSR